MLSSKIASQEGNCEHLIGSDQGHYIERTTHSMEIAHEISGADPGFQERGFK